MALSWSNAQEIVNPNPPKYTDPAGRVQPRRSYCVANAAGSDARLSPFCVITVTFQW
jgi:hypothetical protein